MSLGSRMKSEYMKCYREPRWDEYAPCYRELLLYRLGRRLLEQAHLPWLWDDRAPNGASDYSASSGAGSPAPQGARDSLPQPTELGAPEGPVGDTDDTSLPALPVKDTKEKPEQQVRTNETHRLPSCEPQRQQGALFASAAGKAVRSPPRSSSKTKEKQHPFVLYGWGEKQTDIGSRRTHNVCASAPECEIHKSALRAKTRREMEKRKPAAQRQRAHSADAERSRRTKTSISGENPWMTEYMRCYSAGA